MHKILRLLSAAMLLASLMLAPLNLRAEIPDKVTYTCSGSSMDDNPSLRRKIQTQVSRLLTAMNTTAAERSESINLRGIDFDPSNTQARFTLLQLVKWNFLSTRASGNGSASSISTPCLRNYEGEYEVSNIPVTVTARPNPDNVKDRGSRNEELCLYFNSKGEITGITIMLRSQQMADLLANMDGVVSETARKTVIKWMEQMATAYNTRDLEWFRNTFSDDVVVITGSVRSRTVRGEGGVRFREEYVKYVKQNKAQYLHKLETKIFPKHYIDVSYGDDFEVNAHAFSDRYYSVEVTQYWKSTGYEDVGRLFVVWDFGIPDHPQILLRAWTDPKDKRHFDFDDVEGLQL